MDFDKNLKERVDQLLYNSPPQIILKGWWRKFLPWERKKQKLFQDFVDYTWKNGGAEEIKKKMENLIKKI